MGLSDPLKGALAPWLAEKKSKRARLYMCHHARVKVMPVFPHPPPLSLKRARGAL